jgi:hypothetical protein
VADTPLDSLHEQLDTISDSRKYRCRDTIHLPFTQGSATSDISLFTYADEDGVPEYVCDSQWFVSRGYGGTSVALDSHRMETETAAESVYTLEATRRHSDGTVMQTFSARFTFRNVGGDWRCVIRQPLGITKP